MRGTSNKRNTQFLPGVLDGHYLPAGIVPVYPEGTYAPKSLVEEPVGPQFIYRPQETYDGPAVAEFGPAEAAVVEEWALPQADPKLTPPVSVAPAPSHYTRLAREIPEGVMPNTFGFDPAHRLWMEDMVGQRPTRERLAQFIQSNFGGDPRAWAMAMDCHARGVTPTATPRQSPETKAPPSWALEEAEHASPDRLREIARRYAVSDRDLFEFTKLGPLSDFYRAVGVKKDRYSDAEHQFLFEKTKEGVPLGSAEELWKARGTAPSAPQSQAPKHHDAPKTEPFLDRQAKEYGYDEKGKAEMIQRELGELSKAGYANYVAANTGKPMGLLKEIGRCGRVPQSELDKTPQYYGADIPRVNAIPVSLGNNTIYLDPESPAGMIADSRFGRWLNELPMPDRGEIANALATGGMAPIAEGTAAAEEVARTWLQSVGTRAVPGLARYWEPIASAVVGAAEDATSALAKHDYATRPITADDVVKSVVAGRTGSAAGDAVKRVVPKGPVQPIVGKGAKKATSIIAGQAYDKAREKRKERPRT